MKLEDQIRRVQERIADGSANADDPAVQAVRRMERDGSIAPLSPLSPEVPSESPSESQGEPVPASGPSKADCLPAGPWGGR